MHISNLHNTYCTFLISNLYFDLWFSLNLHRKVNYHDNVIHFYGITISDQGNDKYSKVQYKLGKCYQDCMEINEDEVKAI